MILLSGILEIRRNFMNRWFFSSVLFAIVICFLSPRLCGDSLIMTENRVFDAVWTESFTGPPENSFIFRPVKDGKAESQGFPVPENNVIKITFKPLGDGEEISYRRADMTLSGDRVFNGVSVLQYENNENGGVFTVRPADAAPDNQGFPVRSASIIKLQFINDATPTPTPRVVLLADLLVATPSPTPAPPKPTDTPPVTDEPVAFEGPPLFLDNSESAHVTTGTAQATTGATHATTGVAHAAAAATQTAAGAAQTYGAAERFVEPPFSQGNVQIVDETRFFGLSKMASTKEGFLILDLILRAFGAIISGFVIWLSCRSARAPMSFLKSILTAAIISIVGGVVWKICMFIPICGVNVLIAIVAWFFATRAIIMGMADVLEEKATLIVITIIIINMALFVGVMFLIVGGIALVLAV